MYSAGKYVENHGVIHNMWFNTSTSEKKTYYQTQFVNEWWDNGSLPIWITAQRQVQKQQSWILLHNVFLHLQLLLVLKLNLGWSFGPLVDCHTN